MSAPSFPAEEASDHGLGGEIESFVPSRANLVAGIILAAAAIPGGVAFLCSAAAKLYRAGGKLPMEGNGNDNWAAVGLFLVLGAVLLFVGAVLALFTRSLFTQSITLHERGFRYCEGGTCEAVPWSRVTRIRKTILYERPPLLTGAAKLLLPKVASTSWGISAEGEKSFAVDGNRVKNIRWFGERLEAIAKEQGIAVEVVEEHPRV